MITLTNKEWVRATCILLRENGKKSIWFDPDSYEQKDDIPFCNALQLPVCCCSMPDKLSDKLSLCGDDDGKIVYETFTGEEDEDFEYLFYLVYDEAGLEELYELSAEDWLKQHKNTICHTS